jgi:type III restriction enzyme
VPKYLRMSKNDIRYISEYISKLPDEEKLRNFREILSRQLGKVDSIEELELKTYIEKVLKNLKGDQIKDLENSPFKYSFAIKKKILSLQDEFMELEFYNLVDKDKIVCKDSFTFKTEISPTKTLASIAKSLYQAEEYVNDFEHKVITDIASLENIMCWHRNIERKGFCVNGFTNHYPDFIILTMGGKILIVETKGDHLSNEENLKKLKLGRKWQELAGKNYKYFMVFQNKKINIDGAYSFDEFMKIVKEIE